MRLGLDGSASVGGEVSDLARATAHLIDITLQKPRIGAQPAYIGRFCGEDAPLIGPRPRSRAYP